MRLGKKTSRAISIALLAAMASTSLPQVDVLAAVKNGMFLSVSYTDKDGNNNNTKIYLLSFFNIIKIKTTFLQFSCHIL